MDEADASGFIRFLTFMIFNDNHFNKEVISKSGKKYNYFHYREAPTKSSSFYNRVMDLCSRCLLKDPMGADRRVVDIYGYTPDDLMNMDYASLVDLENRLRDIEERHDKDMNEKAKLLDHENTKVKDK